jgi:hypothetical protein
MKKIFLTVALTAFYAFLFAGEPVPGAEVFVEQEPNNEPIAFQVTGSSGTITFDHLDIGTYSIRIILPKPDDKLTKGKDKVKADLKSVYNAEKKIYYIREPQGFFAVKFDGLKKIAGANVAPAYEKAKSTAAGKLLIANFTVTDSPGEITVKVEGLTPKEFASKTKKLMHDTAKAVIQNVR